MEARPGPARPDEGEHVPSKLVTLAAVGALTLGGAALAGTALAATGGAAPSLAPTPSYAPLSPRPDDAAARAERIKQALAGLVADKTLTQAQADKVASTLAASGVGRGPGAPGHFGGPRALGAPALGAAAKALGTTQADLLTQLRSGKSLAAVAKDKGIDVQKVVDALVAEAKQRIADAVKSGRLTQAQADQRLKNLTARITAKVNATRPDGPGRAGPGGPGRWHGPGNAPGSGPSSVTPSA
jgi:hypothetical protein